MIATGLEFLRNERGILPDTIEAFGLSEDNGTLVIPYPTGTRYRGIEDSKRTFRWDKGSKVSLFPSPQVVSNTAFICEGETDTMRLWQEAKVNTFGLPGLTTWQDEMADTLSRFDTIYVILDNESDYTIHTVVEQTYQKIRRACGPKVRRIILPADCKDVCDFFDKYTISTFDELVKSPTVKYNFNALDLTKEPPPYNWLWEGNICRGDVNLFIGEPKVGKSWVSMGLTTAIVEGHTAFLGNRLFPGTSRVLYVDEENPEDLILNRLSSLGLTETGRNNLRFLHRPGLKLDRNGELLLDDAFSFQPDLIVLDSLTRIHSMEEDRAGDIAGLFNDSINPLARETGAAILLIHHVGKTESSSSFRRARGSSDLSASVDAAFDLRSVGDHLNLIQYYSRRRGGGTLIPIAINDKEGGRTVVEVHEDNEPF